MKMEKKWFIHIEGESVGPITTETIETMLAQRRLGFADYIWCDELTKWHRVIDLDTFARLLPTYPGIPIPRQNRSSDSVSAQASAPAPAPVLASIPPTLASVPSASAKTEPSVVVPVAVQKKQWPKARNFVRVRLEGAFAEIAGHGKFEVLNMSEGGLFLQSPQPLAIGAVIDFIFTAKIFTKPLKLSGFVVRHGEFDGIGGFAIQFRRLNPAYKREFQNYVKLHAPESA